MSARFSNSATSLSSRSDAGSRNGATSGMSATRGQIFTTVAEYRGSLVAIKECEKKKVPMDRAFLMEMKNVTFFLMSMQFMLIW